MGIRGRTRIVGRIDYPGACPLWGAVSNAALGVSLEGQVASITKN
jgi:hypothetical protein